MRSEQGPERLRSLPGTPYLFMRKAWFTRLSLLYMYSAWSLLLSLTNFLARGVYRGPFRRHAHPGTLPWRLWVANDSAALQRAASSTAKPDVGQQMPRLVLLRSDPRCSRCSLADPAASAAPSYPPSRSAAFSGPQDDSRQPPLAKPLTPQCTGRLACWAKFS